MNTFEKGLLAFLAATAPTVETLFIHNQRSVAIFNASDNLLNGVVEQITQTPLGSATTPPVQPAVKVTT